MRFRTLSVASLIFASLLFACGDTPDTSDASDDAGIDAPGAAYPAFAVDAPQVLDVAKGPLLAAPRVVPIFFQDDDTTFTGELTKFLNAMATSTYWGPQVAEYGVGKLTIAAPVTLAQSPPANLASSDIHAWVASEVTSDAAFPKPDASTVYALFYPSGTTIASGGGTSCVDFWAFHGSVAAQNQNVPFAVSPRCAQFPQGWYGASLSGVDAVTAPISHEIIEAATDPFAGVRPAWGTPDPAHAFLPLLVGGPEVGDFCYPFEASYFVPSDIGHAVARTWSNAAAAAGHDPCVPADTTTPYFNAMPIMPDDVVVSSTKAKGLILPVGTTKTVELDLFSDAPTSGPWTVGVEAFSSALGFSLDKTQGQNGDKLELTVTSNAKSPGGWDGLVIDSKLGARHNYWIAYVSNQ